MDELEKDDVFYDIGANTGLYTLFASKRCTEGTVIAFEPYPPNVAMLKRDISRNGVENVDVYELALSDSEGMMSFSQPEQPDVGYGSASVEADPSESMSEIPTTTGDDLISKGKIPAPNVVKIDVEGAESLVMEGMEEALSSPACRLVYCEVHLPGVGHRPPSEAFGATRDDIQDLLEELGFTIQDEQSRDNEVALKAVKRSISI
jgi:FkbM family methyltransferase